MYYEKKGERFKFGHSHQCLVLLIMRQQLETDNERLTSDKTDLLFRLQCYEEDLKAANECKKLGISNNTFTINSVLTMKEKAISGMMVAVHRETIDKDDRITHLTKVTQLA